MSAMKAEASRGMQRVAPQALAGLAPLVGLSAERLAELATMVELERVTRGTDVLAERAAERRSLFLISGEMLLAFAKGGTLVVVGGSEEARAAINRRTPAVARSRAITDVDVIVIDDEVLDILATWDELAATSSAVKTGRTPERRRRIGACCRACFPSPACAAACSPSCRLRISIRCSSALSGCRCGAARW